MSRAGNTRCLRPRRPLGLPSINDSLTIIDPGAPLPDGRYLVVVSFSDALGDVQISVPLTIDTAPPILTLADLPSLRFTLSEPATVTALVNQKTRIMLAEPKGTFTLPFIGGVLQVSAVAQDAAGNVSSVVGADG